MKNFGHDQTSHDKIQYDTTRYNKVAKLVQHFIQHIMLHDVVRNVVLVWPGLYIWYCY